MMRKADMTLTPISDFVREVAATDKPAAMAFFLMDQNETVTGSWSGRMSVKDQRSLFGMVVGRGRLIVNGATEMVTMVVSQCFGMDFSTEFHQPWTALDSGVLSDNLYGLGHMAQPSRYKLGSFS